MLRIAASLPNRLAQHVLMEIQIAGGLSDRNTRSSTSLAASSLNARPTFRLCSSVEHLISVAMEPAAGQVSLR